MANRYLVATGNWNSTSVWSATSGGASGASVPVAGDTVYINVNYTVTLTANAECGTVIHTNGTLNLSSYTLTATPDAGWSSGLYTSGTAARTINLGSGRLVLNGSPDSEKPYGGMSITGSNLTFTAGTSTVELNISAYEAGYTTTLATNGVAFNDVIVRFGASNSNNTGLNITGSPTFRLLDIRSANSAAHTVNFDSDVAINVNKFIAIGSSSSNKLTLAGNSDGLTGTQIVLQSGGTSYGQFVHASGVRGNTFSGVPKYLGSNSTQTTGAFGTMQWLLQDPPKISTLVDPLTTAPGSNPNWTTSGTVTQVASGHGGGGYTSDFCIIESTNTYDFIGSKLVVELLNLDYDEGSMFALAGTAASGIFSGDEPSPVTAIASLATSGGGESSTSSIVTYTGTSEDTGSALQYVSIEENSGSLIVKRSSDGSSWVELNRVDDLNDTDLALLRSVRVSAATLVSTSLYNQPVIGSINPTLGFQSSKTQTATARIRVPHGIGAFGYGFNEQPFNGIQEYASPAVELTRTQTAIAKIASSVSATQSATAYLIQSGSFTQSATARVANTVSVTQATKASISNTRSATQSAIAKIVKTFTATQPAVAKISVQATITQTAIAKIARTLSAAQGATARVLVSFQATNTQTSVARIANTYTRTQTAFARIAATATSTQTAKSAIANTETATQTATAVIVISREIEQTATAAISVQPEVTQSATARIGILYDNPTDGDGDRKYDEFGIPTGEVNAVIPYSGDRIYDVGVIDEGEYTSRSINEDNIYTVD